MDRLSDIAVFVRVVEQGSFTSAADALDISKAAVSKYVSRLERRLGARLLNRTTRKLTLTEAGTALFDGASGALDQIKSAEDVVYELVGEPRGRLRVTAPAYFGATFLIPLIAGFLKKYPRIRLELDLENRVVDLVEERFDVGIRITTLADSSMVARRLASVRMVTAASPRYLERAGIPKHPQDLTRHSCLTYSLTRTPGEWYYRGRDGESIRVPVGGGLRCNSDQALKEAALAGIGVVRFPGLFISSELSDDTLVRLLPDFELEPSSICAVFPSRSNLAPKVRAFVDFIAATLKTELPVT